MKVVLKGRGKAKGSRSRDHQAPRIMVAMEPELFERVAGDAARRGVPVSYLIRECCRLYFGIPEPDAEAA